MLLMDVLFCWPSIVGQWLVSPAGSAVASWCSSLVGAIAIVIAVKAYLNDRQRAEEDRARERLRADKLVSDYLDVVLTLIDQGITLVRTIDEQARAKPEAAIYSNSTFISAQILPIADALDRIGSGLAPNAMITLAVSRAIAEFRKARDLNRHGAMRANEIAEATENALEKLGADRDILAAEYPVAQAIVAEKPSATMAQISG